MVADPRAVLEMLIRERGEDYASLSRLLGRNSAYVQQFIKRGVPKKLDEEDRRILAQYFGISEAELGARPAADRQMPSLDKLPRRATDLVAVPVYDVRASAGPGTVPTDDAAPSRVAFQAGWLRELTGGSPAKLSIIQVKGDSMTPTLADGDDILVDQGDGAERLRDGIYVLRNDDMLNVKRIAVNPVDRSLEVRSDNPAYPAFKAEPGAIEVIGRVVWAGRRIV
jgi:phage repressor protein C with HTH and peptisase S24 domain